MLNTISNRQFLSILKTRKLENISVIRTIEKSLISLRGFVFRMPKPGSSVILLLSGGLDSVTSWGILMEEFGLHVYPLSFDRGEKRANKEKASIDYFSNFYQKRFPDLYHQPLRFSLGVEDITLPIEQGTATIHPEVILENLKKDGRLIDLNPSFGSFLVLPIYGKLYAEYLYYTQKKNVSTIFSSVTRGDGLLTPHQTFTALRSVMHYLCTASRNYKWQFTSVVFEKEMGLCFNKSDLVRWADEHNIPLEKTWSCYHSKKHQCGGDDCVTCFARREAFAQAGVIDKTPYRRVQDQIMPGAFQYQVSLFLKRAKSLINKIGIE